MRERKVDISSLPSMPPNVLCGKIPEWSFKDLNHRSCPACNADTPKKVCTRPDKLEVHQCELCQMIYLADIPSLQELSSLYSSYGNFKGYFRNNVSIKPLSRRKLYSLAKNHFVIQILDQFDGLSGYKFCEIGSSSGILLQIAQYKGAIVTGVELDEKARSITKLSLGIPTYKSIEDCTELQEIVCAISVFEHIENPFALLQKIYSKCSKDARLLLSMPNGYNYHKIGPTWVGFRVDLEHLNYFSLNTLSSLLSKTGFLIEQNWEINQLFTNRTTCPQTFFRRILSKLRRHSWNPQRQGSATLVALARKV